MLASRGDALTPHLFTELARRYPIGEILAPELRPAQRYAVAAATFRPGRRRWAEQFYKSHLGYRLRSANAARALADSGCSTALVFQVHALFEVRGAPTVLYVDCTHRQSAQHWPDWNPLRGKALQRWYDRETAAYRQAEHIFAFCRATADSLIGDYGVAPERVTIAGIGINFDGAAPAAPAGRQEPPTVLFVGNDFVRKGGPELLAAFRQVRRELPQARLRLAGADPHVAAEPGVEILGRIHDRKRMAGLYAGASVFCVPSHFDPLPHVLLEAMAFGLPAVASDSCGIPDVVTSGHDGVLVKAGDVAGLAQALISLLTDRRRAAQIGAAAQNRVFGQFTWARVVDRMAPALNSLLEL